MKSCRECQKEFNYPGYYCHWCSQKRLMQKRIGIPCSKCNQIKPICQKSLTLCTSCYHKYLEERDPIYKEKKRLNSFKSRRRCRGQDPDAPLMKRRNGEGSLDKNGYFQITKFGHPNCTSKTGRIAEHTWVMSQYLGRPLHKHESVHHKNGIRDDNRIENLELWSKSQPSGQRLTDKIMWCKQFLESYGYKILEKGGSWEVITQEDIA